MLIAIAVLALATSSAEAAGKSSTPCGLEEVSDPALKICPSYVTYDEEGEEVGGEHEQQADADSD